MEETKHTFTKLQAEFKNRIVQKTYVALVHGRVDESGEIDAPLGRLPWRRDRFGIVAGGRTSLTLYKPLQFFPGNNVVVSF